MSAADHVVCAKCGNDRFSEDHVITAKGTAVTFKTVLVCDECRTPYSGTSGSFSVETSEGTLSCQDGYLCIDARGYPYPVAQDEFDLIYEATDQTERAEAAEAELAEANRRVDGMARAPYGEYDAMRVRAEAAEAKVARLQNRIDCADTPMMRDVLAERDKLREALIAWWEPQRHVGNCECRACTLTRDALGSSE